jgi:hypothetical protein
VVLDKTGGLFVPQRKRTLYDLVVAPIVFGPARSRLVLFLIGAIVFALSGPLIILIQPSIRNTLVGIACAGFFGGGAVVLARQLYDARPRLVVNDEGIFDSVLCVGVIPWDNIVGAKFQSFAGLAVVVLRLRNMDGVLPRLAPVHRRLAERNKTLGLSDLSISVATVATDPRALAELISKEAMARHSLQG